MHIHDCIQNLMSSWNDQRSTICLQNQMLLTYIEDINIKVWFWKKSICNILLSSISQCMYWLWSTTKKYSNTFFFFSLFFDIVLQMWKGCFFNKNFISNKIYFKGCKMKRVCFTDLIMLKRQKRSWHFYLLKLSITQCSLLYSYIKR